MKCTFEVKLDFDESISEKGELDTSDKRFPIKWFDYGLRLFFPNNPFNPDYQRAKYDRHDELRAAVSNDLNTKLLDCLIENANKKTTISFGKYWVIINGD